MGQQDERAAAAEREIALRSVAQIEAAYGRSANESAALARWLIGALAIMNGGGLLVTVMIRNEIDPVAARLAVAVFGAGLTVAFLAVCLSAVAALWLSASLRKASAAWMGAATGDGISDYELLTVRRVRGRARLSRLLVAITGFIAAFLLVCGVAILWREFIAPAFAAKALQEPTDAGLANAAEPVEPEANVVTLVAENHAEPAQKSVSAPAPAPVIVAQPKPASAPVAVKVVTAPPPKAVQVKPAPQKAIQPTPVSPRAPEPAIPPKTPPQLPYAPPSTSETPSSSPPAGGSSPSPQ